MGVQTCAANCFLPFSPLAHLLWSLSGKPNCPTCHTCPVFAGSLYHLPDLGGGGERVGRVPLAPETSMSSISLYLTGKQEESQAVKGLQNTCESRPNPSCEHCVCIRAGGGGGVGLLPPLPNPPPRIFLNTLSQENLFALLLIWIGEPFVNPSCASIDFVNGEGGWTPPHPV